MIYDKRTSDLVLECILQEYKSATQISKELNIPYRTVQVHIFKMRKYREIVRCLNDDGNQGRVGFKFRAAWCIRHSKKYRDLLKQK